MSKKNRNKSRVPHRPSSPSTAPAAVVRDTAAGVTANDALEPSSERGQDNKTSATATDRTEAEAMPPAIAEVEARPGTQAQDAAVDAPAVSDAAEAPAAPTPAVAETQVPAPLPFTVPTPAPMASQGDIRGVLIQVAGARLLLPNATIAEVLSYADPEPVGADAPAWLLGRLRWRGWQVPLLAFGTLAGVAEERAVLGSKVVVLKALAGTARTPYFAMLTQGFPRLVTVSRQALSVEGDEADALPRGVQARVRLNEDPALLPDLEAIEALVADAVAHAA